MHKILSSVYNLVKKVKVHPYSASSVGQVLISGARSSAPRWPCHTSAVGGQVFQPNPRLPSQSVCYSFLSRHLGSTRLSEPCEASGVCTRYLLIFMPANHSAIVP